MPRTMWVAPARRTARAPSTASRRVSDVVPVRTWAAKANPAGSRPASAIAASMPRAFRRSRGCRSRGWPAASSRCRGGRRARGRDAPGRRARSAARRASAAAACSSPRRAGRTGRAGDAGLGAAASLNSALTRGTADTSRSIARRIGGTDTERHVLALEPAGAEPDDEPAARGVVEDVGGLRDDRPAGGTCSTGRRGRPSCPARGGRGPRSRERLQLEPRASRFRIGDVVVHPAASKHPELAGPRPGRVERRPVDVLRRGLEPDPDSIGADRAPSQCADQAAPSSAGRSSPRPPTRCSTSAAYFAMTPPV